jgi:hypothetical protein
LINITRHAARRLRAMLRRSVLGITHRGALPPLVLHAESQHLRAQFRYQGLAIEYVEANSHRVLDSIPVPLGALADFEAHDETPVVIEAAEHDKTVIRWLDHGIPQTREYPVTPFGKIEPFPETPTAWTEISGDVLEALEEASRTCADDSNRYALDCIQLRGTVHKIVASDGHQVLVRSAGFELPWDGDLLIKGSPVFACKVLPGSRPLRIGKTDTHVVFRAGPWTTFHEIRKDARFPSVDELLSEQDALATLLQLNTQDARFLEAALERLPGSDELNSPATLDLNGKVTIRALAPVTSQVTELVLNGSRYSGPAIRINTNRRFLSRALQLGFREIGIAGVEAPIVCREPHRVYAWQPLNGDAALVPAGNVLRIESSTATSTTRSDETAPKPPRRIMRAPTPSNGHESAVTANGNGHLASDNNGTSLATLIQDAEALHTTLTDARTSVARLIAGLRRHRKQSRLVSVTLKSLRQLKLTETAD